MVRPLMSAGVLRGESNAYRAFLQPDDADGDNASARRVFVARRYKLANGG